MTSTSFLTMPFSSHAASGDEWTREPPACKRRGITLQLRQHFAQVVAQGIVRADKHLKQRMSTDSSLACKLTFKSYFLTVVNVFGS